VHRSDSTREFPIIQTAKLVFKDATNNAQRIGAIANKEEVQSLNDIVITNSVWCMAYKREVGGGGRILPNSRAIILHQGGQCR